MPKSANVRVRDGSPDPQLAHEQDIVLSVPTEKAAVQTTHSPKLLVSAKEACGMCGKSLRTWRAWDAAGWIPQPVRIGRSTLWRVHELCEWVAAGCPRRQEWEALSGKGI
jgi:predicted DNA-binding transcriptional regulator AlpA